METTNEKCSICESKLIWNSALSTESFNKFYCETEDCEFGYIGIPTKNYKPKPPKIKKEKTDFNIDRSTIFDMIVWGIGIFIIIGLLAICDGPNDGLYDPYENDFRWR